MLRPGCENWLNTLTSQMDPHPYVFSYLIARRGRVFHDDRMPMPATPPCREARQGKQGPVDQLVCVGLMFPLFMSSVIAMVYTYCMLGISAS